MGISFPVVASVGSIKSWCYLDTEIFIIKRKEDFWIFTTHILLPSGLNGQNIKQNTEEPAVLIKKNALWNLNLFGDFIHEGDLMSLTPNPV